MTSHIQAGTITSSEIKSDSYTVTGSSTATVAPNQLVPRSYLDSNAAPVDRSEALEVFSDAQPGGYTLNSKSLYRTVSPPTQYVELEAEFVAASTSPTYVRVQLDVASPEMFTVGAPLTRLEYATVEGGVETVVGVPNAIISMIPGTRAGEIKIMTASGLESFVPPQDVKLRIEFVVTYPFVSAA